MDKTKRVENLFQEKADEEKNKIINLYSNINSQINTKSKDVSAEKLSVCEWKSNDICKSIREAYDNDSKILKHNSYFKRLAHLRPAENFSFKQENLITDGSKLKELIENSSDFNPSFILL